MSQVNDSKSVDASHFAKHAAAGDLLYSISLAMALAFALAVVLYADHPNQSLFDKEWVKEGFCIANPDAPFWTSHDTSFYADALLTFIMLALYFRWRKESHLQGICSSRMLLFAAATIGHGVGHAALAHIIRGSDGGIDPQFEYEANWKEMCVRILVFWFPLLMASCSRSPWYLVAVSAVVAQWGLISIPLKFEFTYVQTVLLASHAVSELTRPIKEKGWEYATFPLLLNVPIGIVGWTESLACTSFYRSIGGHVWYDTTLGAGLILFYVACHQHGQHVSKTA